MSRRHAALVIALIAVVVGLGLQQLGDAELRKEEAKRPSAAAVAARQEGTGAAMPLDARSPQSRPDQAAGTTADAASATAKLPDAGSRESERLRAARKRLAQLLGCQAARAQPTNAERLAEWARALPDEALANADRDYEAALAWAPRDCPGAPGVDDHQASHVDSALLLAAGFRADDPLVQLQRLFPPDNRAVVDPTQVRLALYQTLSGALAEPDVAQFLAIAQAGMHARRQRQFGPFLSFDGEMGSSVWALAACDLGADCGPQSAAMRMLCLSEQLCGYPSLEAAMIDAYWPQGSIESLSRMRRDLVARLRENGGVGIFEPPAPDGG